MAKKSLTLEEVREKRTAGKAFVFNLEVALEATANAAPKVRSAKFGDLNIQLIEIFSKSGAPLSIGQVCAGFEACGATVDKDFRKSVSDKCWGLAKKGILNKLGGGMYQIAASDASEEAAPVEETSDAE